MPTDDHNDLPQTHQYLSEILRTYTILGGTIDEYQRVIAGLNSEAIAQIRAGYERLSSGNESQTLSRWVASRDDEYWARWRQWQNDRSERERSGRPRLDDSQTPQRPRALELFKLFRALSRAGIKPFDLDIELYAPPRKAPDWSNLPAQLAYLRAPAERYGTMQFEEDRSRFRQNATLEQRAELQAIARRLRDSGHYKLVDDWLLSHPITESAEASLVYWLIAQIREM